MSQDERAAEHVAIERLRSIPALVNSDPVLLRRGRFLTADIQIGIGAARFILSIDRGRLGTVEPATALMRSWTFAVRAEAVDWLGHWREPAAAGWYDILGMKKRGLMAIEGDMRPFLQNLQYVKDVLASPRRAAPPPE